METTRRRTATVRFFNGDSRSIHPSLATVRELGTFEYNESWIMAIAAVAVKSGGGWAQQEPKYRANGEEASTRASSSSLESSISK